MENPQVIVDADKNSLNCDYCKKEFSRIDALTRHINGHCKQKEKQIENKKEQIFKKLLNEMKFIKKQNEKLKDEISQIKNINKGSIINNTLDQSNNISNIFNIQLVAYGKEDYDKLSDKEYQIIINKGFKSIQEMVKSLHFNKNRPAIIKSSI